MENQVISNIIKQAEANGLSKEATEQFLATCLVPALQKQAEDELNTYTNEIVKQAGVEANPQVFAYVHGILKEAVDMGMEIAGAGIAASQILQTQLNQKTAQVNTPDNTMTNEQIKFAAFAEGFMKQAQEGYGLTEGQAVDAFNYAVKQSQEAPAPTVKPVEKVAFDMQQLMQLLQSNPELMQALMGAAGQGGAEGGADQIAPQEAMMKNLGGQ